MTLDKNFVVAELGDGYAAVPVGESAGLNCIIQLNKTGKMIWDYIAEGLDTFAIVEKLIEQYDVDKKTALQNVEAICEKLIDVGVLQV